MKYTEINQIVSEAKHLIVLQADNPDGDSLGSALALEAILCEMGKTVSLVCNVDMPTYLRHLQGWDRVVKEIPHSFDATIIVDTSTETLFENTTTGFNWIKTKPVIVLDHHMNSSGLSFATVCAIEPVVATSELIHNVAIDLGWPLPLDACNMMVMSIMSDSLGLTTSNTTADSFRVVGDLVSRGVNIAELDAARRELMKKDPVLIPYKGELLKRAEFSVNGRLASVTIPHREIIQYSPLYNPTMLVMDDLRMTVGVEVVIGFKAYDDGRITAKIRCNYGSAVADKLANNFGGGGHPYAAGFKILDGTSLENIKKRVESLLPELLENAKAENDINKTIKNEE
jgi:phosphoesterase RecJ-like protein